MLSLFCFVAFAFSAIVHPDDIDPVLWEQYNRLQVIEGTLAEAISTAESAVPFTAPEDIAEREAELENLTREAENILKGLGPALLKREKLTAVPLVLVNSTLSFADKGTWNSLPKTSSGLIPESRDFRGWVIHDSGVVLHYRPLILLDKEADGIFFLPTQNKTCEVKQFELTALKDQKVVMSETYELERHHTVSLLEFPGRVKFDEITFAVLNNWGDPNRTCVGKFDLFHRSE
jgi:hypothetical protein